MPHYSGKCITHDPKTSRGIFLTPFQRKLLQKSLQEELPEFYSQRIQIMLLADQGKSQTEICRILECSPATVRHWMHIARTGMAHQWQDCPVGRRKAVSDQYLERLQELVSHSPCDYGYSFQRWTATWLSKHLAKELGVEVSDRHILRLLKQIGLSTRPKLSTTHRSIDEGNKAKSSKILISDLNSVESSDYNEFLPINLAKLDTDLQTHDARPI